MGLFGALADGASVQEPSEFYIVTHGIYQQKGNDGTASYHELLTVSPEGRDSIIRYIRLEQVFQIACGRGLIVKAMEARLLGVAPATSLGMLTLVRQIGVHLVWLKNEEVKASVHLNLRRWESSLSAAPNKATCVSSIPESWSLSQPTLAIYGSWLVV